MARKMYYTEAEACEKLGISSQELEDRIRDGKLKSFQDGVRRMFKAADIDMAAGGTSMISLSPMVGDEVTLTEASESAGPAKEDTVITAEGISIFDDEDLDIESADPMAKTQIAPTLEEQLTGQGVGSGSGLLDLTRESDDTSLGAEVLGHIDVDGGLGSDDSMGAGNLAETSAPVAAAPAPAQVVMVEAADPNAAFFGGMIVGGIIAALILMLTTIPAMLGHVPGYLESLKNNGAILVVVLVVVAAASGAIGMFAAKSAARKTATT